MSRFWDSKRPNWKKLLEENYESEINKKINILEPEIPLNLEIPEKPPRPLKPENPVRVNLHVNLF
jgi:hypothetical protein